MCSDAAHSFRNGICLLSVMSIFLCFSGKVTGRGGGDGGSRSLSSVCTVGRE